MADIFGLAVSQAIIETFVVGLWLGLQFGTLWLVFAGDQTQDESQGGLVVPNAQPDNSTQLIDALKHLSTVHRSLHADRIKEEFRVTVTILGFYVAAAGASLQSGTAILELSAGWRCFIALAFFAVAGGAIGYFRSSAKSNAINQQWAQRAEDVLSAMIRTRVEEFNLPRRRNPSRCRWVLWGAVVLLGALVSALLIVRQPPPTPTLKVVAPLPLS